MNPSAAGALIALTFLSASCAIREPPGTLTSVSRYETSKPPPMNPDRTIVEQDCRQPALWQRGNLRCM